MATIQQKLDEAADKLRAEQQKTAELQKDNERLKKIADRYESDELSEPEKNLLKLVSQAPLGLQYHELSASTGIPEAILRFSIVKLSRKNFIAAYGGGDDPMRYRLDQYGANYLIANNLI